MLPSGVSCDLSLVLLLMWKAQLEYCYRIVTRKSTERQVKVFKLLLWFFLLSGVWIWWVTCQCRCEWHLNMCFRLVFWVGSCVSRQENVRVAVVFKNWVCRGGTWGFRASAVFRETESAWLKKVQAQVEPQSHYMWNRWMFLSSVWNIKLINATDLE